MPILSLAAVEYQDPTAGGPGPEAASVCLALARAESSKTFDAHNTPPGDWCFSIYLRARDRPAPVTLVLRDADGASSLTLTPGPVWSRHDVRRESRVGNVSGELFLGEPGHEVPILTDCLFSYPQLEAGRYPTSIIGGRTDRQPWAIYDDAEQAIRARAAADDAAGTPSSIDGKLVLTATPLLQHVREPVFALRATKGLHDAVFLHGTATRPRAVGLLGPDWAGAIPIPLAPAAMMDVADAFAVPAIVDPDGKPLGESSTAVIHADADMRALVDSLGRQPYDLMALDSRDFEKVIAHLLDRDGYEVKLQPKSGRGHPDHGIDILAVRKRGAGQFLMGIQCKRYATGNKVSGEMVRALMGSLLWSNLSRGVLVTTDEFQPQAFEYEAGAPRKVGLELELVDYHRLVRWLKVYGRCDADEQP